MNASSPVESYLDVMFDRLAGTGAAGRRLLTDAESHLYESAAAGRDRGLSDLEAEREAVARFGLVDAIARRATMPDGRLDGRRVLVGAWLLVGTGLLWYGSAGLLTWLLGWPWAKLLIATNRFGSWPPCGQGGATTECLRHQHDSLAMVPAGGLQFPYALVTLVGATVLAALVILRRTTRVGTPAWTPPRASMSFALAAPLAIIGALLTLHGIGNFADGHYRQLSSVVAGITALASAAALRRRIVQSRRLGPWSRRVPRCTTETGLPPGSDH